MYVTNGGPNLISSFHVIGEIFDRAYQYGSLKSPPMEGIQTVLIPPGGAAIVDFGLDVPGDYKLVDHAIARVSKGALGILHVTGDENPETFQDLGAPGAAEPTAPSPAAAEGSATRASTPAPAATATPGGGGGATQEVTITTGDNVFKPNAVEVTAGSRVTVTVRNEGLQPHNMHIATASGAFDAGTVSVPEVILAGQRGTLTWDCPGRLAHTKAVRHLPVDRRGPSREVAASARGRTSMEAPACGWRTRSGARFMQLGVLVTCTAGRPPRAQLRRCPGDPWCSAMRLAPLGYAGSLSPAPRRQ